MLQVSLQWLHFPVGLWWCGAVSGFGRDCVCLCVFKRVKETRQFMMPECFRDLIYIHPKNQWGVLFTHSVTPPQRFKVCNNSVDNKYST